MTEERLKLFEKAETRINAIIDTFSQDKGGLAEKLKQEDVKDFLISLWVDCATENGIQWHDLRKNPNDLPECDESKQITFYVEEWIESIQKYKKHYCLGFYKKSFMNDDVKLFVEKSKGYENEHLPKTVLFWYENPTV